MSRVQNTRYSDLHEIEAPAGESPLVDQVKRADIRAKFKIQVLYGRGRTPSGPNFCTLTFWSNGSRLGGGGDEKLYVCDVADANTLTSPLMGSLSVKPRTPSGQRNDVEKATYGCGMVLPPGSVSGAIAFCPYCHKKWPAAEMLTGELMYKLPTKALAERIAVWWEKLGGNADLYVKYHDEDIHFREMAVREGSEKARALRGLVAYPLANILKDTASGKSLVSAFSSCLSS